MPTLTTCRRYPYPVDADPPDVANDMGKLARAIDSDVCAINTRLTTAEGRAVNAVARSGDTMTGALTIAAPSVPLILRRSGASVDQPEIAFQSLSGSPTFGVVRGTAAGLILNAASAADAVDLQVGGTSRFKISAATAVFTVPIDAAQVRARTTGGAQFQAIDSNGGNQTYIAFYGSGSASATGTRTGYVGYASSTTLQVRNEATNGELGITSTGAASQIWFAPNSVVQLRIFPTYLVYGKAEGDYNNAGVEMFGAGHAIEGSIRSTIDANHANLWLNHIGAANADGVKFLTFHRGESSEIAWCRQTNTPQGINFQNTTTTAPSDYRMKNDHGPITEALERLRQLRPRRLSWKDDPVGEVWDGFFAHEVAEVVPYAVDGEKDAVDDDGEIVAQQLDMDRLVPLLAAAVIELSARLGVLEGGY